MIAIIDYGIGNLRSVQKGFEKIGFEATVTTDPQTVLQAERIVLPGVGAFRDCIRNLEQGGFVEPILKVIADAGRSSVSVSGCNCSFQKVKSSVCTRVWESYQVVWSVFPMVCLKMEKNCRCPIWAGTRSGLNLLLRCLKG